MRVSRVSPLLLLVATLLTVALGARAEDVRRIDASRVKVGQRYRFRLAAGNQSVWEIVSRTEDEVTYRVHMTVAGKELPPGEPSRFALARKPRREDPAGKKPPEETLEVSGVRFPCVILEAETGGTTVRTWQSDVFPEVVKTQMGKDVTQELVEIR